MRQPKLNSEQRGAIATGFHDSNPHVFATLFRVHTNTVHAPRTFVEMFCVIAGTKGFLIFGGDVLPGEKGPPERLGLVATICATMLLSALITSARLKLAGCGHRLGIHMTTSCGGNLFAQPRQIWCSI